MDMDTPTEGSNKRLNQMVAITVVAFSVFLGLCNVKDGNLVQSMDQAKADAVDTWNEYQASRIKLKVDQVALEDLALTAPALKDQGAVAARRAALAAEIAKYQGEGPALQAKAKGFDETYDALNFHDDQFDAADALISIAISAAAVSALTESGWVLAISWGFGALGVLMGVAGFAGWRLHPDLLARLLS